MPKRAGQMGRSPIAKAPARDAEQDQAAAFPPYPPRSHSQRQRRFLGRRLLRQNARAAVHSQHVSDAGPLQGQDVLPLWRLLHGHDVGHQQMGEDVPEPGAGVRGHAGLLVRGRSRTSQTSFCPPAPAWSERPRRMGGLRRIHDQRAYRQQLSRDRSRAKVLSSRWASRSRTTRF